MIGRLSADLWTHEQLSAGEAKIAGGVRVDVPPPSPWMKVLDPQQQNSWSWDGNAPFEVTLQVEVFSACKCGSTHIIVNTLHQVLI